MAGFSFHCRGVAYGVRTNDVSLVERLRELMPLGARVVDDPEVDFLYSVLVGKSQRANVKRFHLLYDGPLRLERSLELENVIETLGRTLESAAAEMSKDEIFLHAGVVEWNGNAIVMPGYTRAGKTSLVKAFLDAGATYYSDEYALIDGKGRVHAYPRKLKVRRTGQQTAFVEEDVASRGVPVGRRAMPITHVLLTQYREGASFRPRILTSGRAVMALMQHSLSIRLRPRAVLRRLRLVAEQAVVLSGARGEASEVVRAVLDSMQNQTRAQGHR